MYLYITFLLLLLQCSINAVKLDLKDYMLAGAIATATTDLLLCSYAIYNSTTRLEFLF